MKRMTICVIVLLVTFLVGCGQNNDGIVGTWQFDTSDFPNRVPGMPEHFYIFNEDGTGERLSVRGERMNFYALFEFYWEEIEEGVLLKEAIRSVEFSGMDNRDQPPTIIFDNTGGELEPEPGRWYFEFDSGQLVELGIISGTRNYYNRVDYMPYNN